MRPAWRIHLQVRIPPKSQQLGSDPESGKIHTPAHVAFQARLSTPCVFTVKELTIKSSISSYSQLWSLYKKWYISRKCLIVNLQSTGCSVTRVSRGQIWKVFGGSYLQSGYWLCNTPLNNESQPELQERKSDMLTTRKWNYEKKIIKYTC